MSRLTMVRRRDGTDRMMMKAYNRSSTGWNETKTMKEDKGSTEARSYRNNPMTTIFMCTNISHVGWGTHGTNKITKITGITDEPRSNTIK